MNRLNYKKTAFGVTVLAIIIFGAVFIGLMSQPQEEDLTVEDYANQFMQKEIKSLEDDNTNVKIVDSKITRLERIAIFDNILTYPIEIWQLKYRLKPDDISRISLPGGMNAIDGWITESASMGQPILIFSYETSNPNFLGTTWTGESDFSKPAGQEVALRIFLERQGLLPQETYSGNHIIVKFPLSTGETCQLFLSQPAVQGEHGIWCVERWMDGNGNVYHVTPDTDKVISHYFKDLQDEVDNGHKPGLINPAQVAIAWINDTLGQNVTLDELNIQYSASIEAFMQSPENNYIGYIDNFEVDKYSNPSFHLYPIEWLTLDDSKRLQELGISPNNLNNGFYIYNPPNNYPRFHQVTEDTSYNIICWGENISHESVTMNQFVEYLKQYPGDYAPLFRIITKDGYVQSITEQYVP